jgi:putative peptide zinc metalloprotease protein
MKWQSNVATMSPEMRSQWGALSARSGAARAESQVIRSGLDGYSIKAPFEGGLHVLDPDLNAGQWLLNGEKLGYLIGSGGVRIVAYFQDIEVQRLRAGHFARFIPDSGSAPFLDMVVEKIHSDRVQLLAEPELAANFGGSVMVREQKGKFFPEGAYYRVEFVPRDGTSSSQFSSFRWRGHVYVETTPEPLLAPYLRTLASVLVRETGF